MTIPQRLLLLWVLTAAGCASLLETKPARFKVDLSALDSVQFIYHPGRSAAAGGAHPVRMDFGGSGYLEKLSGSSPRVLDPFWKQPDGAEWADLRKEHRVLSRAETEAVYQALVDAGCFERGSTDAKPFTVESPHVQILAAINGRKNVILTGEAPFLKIVRDLMARFQP